MKHLSKQVPDIQTTIDVPIGDKSPFHLKVKELQAEIHGIPRLPDESPQLKLKFDEVQKMLKTCASFCRAPAASSFGFPRPGAAKPHIWGRCWPCACVTRALR